MHLVLTNASGLDCTNMFLTREVFGPHIIGIKTLANADDEIGMGSKDDTEEVTANLTEKE